MDEKKRKKTQTSQFGTTGRVSHDSSHFYNSRMYAHASEGSKDVDSKENLLPIAVLDQVIHGSSEVMGEIPDSSIHLMVTSPPYNARKVYDEDLTLEEYLAMLQRVCQETYRVLVQGGRACVNVANLGRKPYIPLNAFISQMMIEIGFLMRGEIIWDKGSSAGSSTAWGSWMSASNPTLRDVHEYILVFSKGSFKRQKGGRTPTIQKDDFLELTRSVWQFSTESASRVGHPAPFPVELPRRLIELYTFKGDVVLDPFLGSGTTALAALQCERHFVGYENVEEYVQIARGRIREHEWNQPS
jgi:site-specific DNA-methyltransferase (adenine-specific)